MSDQCEHHYRGTRCTRPADTHIIGEHKESDDVCFMCAPCKRAFLEGWTAMQSDVEALRQRGTPKRLLNHIMCARVDREEYQRDPEMFL